MAGKLQLTLKRGLAGKDERQKKILAALGLHRSGNVALQPDTPSIRGAVDKVAHLLEVKEI